MALREHCFGQYRIESEYQKCWPTENTISVVVAGDVKMNQSLKITIQSIQSYELTVHV